MAIFQVIEITLAVIVTLASIFYVVTTTLTFRKYSEKKSKGSLYLAMMYLFGAAGSIAGAAIRWGAVSAESINELLGWYRHVIIITFVAFLLAAIYMYLFADRIFFNDPDLVRHAHVIVGGVLIGLFIDRALLGEVLRFDNAVANDLIQTPILEHDLTLFFAAYYFYLVVRISFTFILSARKVKTPERKLMLYTIGISEGLFIISSIFEAMYTRATDPYLFAFSFSMVWFIVFFSALLAYLGWFQPTWFKRMFIKEQ